METSLSNTVSQDSPSLPSKEGNQKFYLRFKKQVEWLEIQTQPLPLEFKQEMEKLGIIKITTINIQNGSPTHPAFQPKIQVAKPQICAIIPMPPINAP